MSTYEYSRVLKSTYEFLVEFRDWLNTDWLNSETLVEFRDFGEFKE